LQFAVTTQGDIQMGHGAEIDYEIRWQNLPMKWKTVISEYQPPSYFVDEQLKGPYNCCGMCTSSLKPLTEPLFPTASITHCRSVR
jgi:hypothetical protein